MLLSQVSIKLESTKQGGKLDEKQVILYLDFYEFEPGNRKGFVRLTF